MADHHNYELDKDTPESIRELLEQDPDAAHTSRNGLPAGEPLNHLVEPDDILAGTDPFEEARQIPVHGKGADRDVQNPNRRAEGSRRG